MTIDQTLDIIVAIIRQAVIDSHRKDEKIRNDAIEFLDNPKWFDRYISVDYEELRKGKKHSKAKGKNRESKRIRNLAE